MSVRIDQPPVALFIFKRPEHTRRVFDAIRRAQPRQLFVFADGPRSSQEAVLCSETRAILNRVDWPCEIVTDYSDTNMGLRRRLVSGINAVFERVEEAIFLEDDCLPDPTFFRYCAELLDRYRNEPRVMHISGDCFTRNHLHTSYYFTRYAHVWGWASWRRAWEQYDAAMAGWNDPAIRADLLARCSSDQERAFWAMILPDVQSGRIGTWDYQWAFALLRANALAINPRVNLIRNIGFGSGATHTMNMASVAANRAAESMQFPLIHPDRIEADAELDTQTAAHFFSYTPRHFEALRQRWYRVRKRWRMVP